mmetsp:Transcript_104222/g.261356  ORF Transcript_104222/g.261356 Transcript_104222/m.261356 type:complete len:237 (+) Transcript_104222:94-804(+)
MAARHFARAVSFGLLALGGTAFAESGNACGDAAENQADEDAVCALQRTAVKKDDERPAAAAAAAVEVRVGVRRHGEQEAKKAKHAKTARKRSQKRSEKAGEEGWPWSDEEECAQLWEQCGGITHRSDGSEEPWAGPTCCDPSEETDVECVRDSEYYSQCKPLEEEVVGDDEETFDPHFDDGEAIADEDCVAAWGQCGGILHVNGEEEPWNGPMCCVTGYECILQNQYYAQCMPYPH